MVKHKKYILEIHISNLDKSRANSFQDFFSLDFNIVNIKKMYL